MRIGAIIAASALSGCDDEDHADLLGGGPGSSQESTDVTAGDGFCSPQGGVDALGAASYNASAIAKIDSDGDPTAKGLDANWQSGTSGSVNGGTVNASKYAFVVMDAATMRNDGVQLGDWATVRNNATGATVTGRVEDKGPAGGSGEISEAAATAVGINYTANRFTVGNPSVTVQVFGGTADIQGDCSTSVAMQ